MMCSKKHFEKWTRYRCRSKMSQFAIERCFLFFLSSSGIEKDFVINFLPPIEVQFSFPQNYPSEVCPKFKLACQWLSGDQIDILSQKFRDIWYENCPTVILFHWISSMKEDVLQLLKITDSLNLTPILDFVHSESEAIGAISNCQIGIEPYAYSSLLYCSVKWC
jgi:hypothetical protein